MHVCIFEIGSQVCMLDLWEKWENEDAVRGVPGTAYSTLFHAMVSTLSHIFSFL